MTEMHLYAPVPHAASPHAAVDDDHTMTTAKDLYASGFACLLNRQYMDAHAIFLEVFKMLRDTDAPHGLMLATESLVKVAECKLASNQFTACTHICSSLLSRRHCIPPIRTRVLLVRALALAGLHLFDNALADLQRCSQLSPADKQHALHCLVQRIQYHKRLQEAAEDSACSSSTRLASDDDCSSCSQA